MSHASFVTAHVLDSVRGAPAAGIDVHLTTADGTPIARARTNDDGRVPELGPPTLESGVYRITFSTGEYFAARDQATFYPSVTIDFRVDAAEQHYHVPLLLSPFAFSTYRGS
ncbi:5-hydroxyisourate hydrolase [Kineosphaera limosa]|uniref:5-hydroxyisourate hydrolase n=1 Tax=Kineosphaera limosa NBRC 100340 TaxID=1184609 RepID=K6W8V9_9MICO|nr:hydroxyisourate hydrolase [Kineosphaera limosa]NYD99675.1 5-hydroxyisourate hydrolase [Kineosphaera limosa]GAB95630.1 putative 5-hydroxyisourate hydrolase [Kineosphaera limosa NBRC 100340]